MLLALEMLRAGPRGNYNANWLDFRILRPNMAQLPAMKLADLKNNYRQVPAPPLTCHLSLLTCHRSPLTSHLSHLTSHISHLTCHLSPLTAHLSPLTAHLSPLTSHISPVVQVKIEEARPLWEFWRHFFGEQGNCWWVLVDSARPVTGFH